MSKTTIDGLKVRSSSERSVSRTPKKPSTKTTSLAVRKRTSFIQEASLASDPLLQKSAAEEFLEPVESLDYGETTADLAENSDQDWSEILGEIQAPKRANNTKLLDDFVRADASENADWLDDWGGKRDSKYGPEFGLDEFDRLEDDFDEEIKTEKKLHTNRTDKHFKRKKKHHIGRIVAVAVLLLIVIGGGVLYFWGDGLISRLTGGNSGLWDTLSAMISDEIPFETDELGRTNVLIFGTEGYNMDGDTAYGQHGGAQLTDSIMVVSFDQKTRDVALLSLPRDLKVPMACSAGKINEVFWCNNQSGTNEQAGARALMKQVGDILGLDFQYYAHVNWASLIEIIDTIGGITVTLDEDINDYGWTGAVAQAGVPIEVNGEQALGLARARHGTTGGDFTRGNTQQKIVEAIVSKVASNGIGISEIIGLLNILGDNLRSNFSSDNIKAGVRFVSGFSTEAIRQVPLVDYNTNTFYVTTATINDISYVVPAAGANNYSQIREYVDLMFNNDPVKRENAKIVVYNATGGYGVAGAERDRLKNDGFNVVGVADARSETCTERYCIYAMSEETPATSEALAERYGVTVGSIYDIPEGLRSNEVDFVVIIGALEESEA